MNLSPNFTLAKMIRSQTAVRDGINNTPDQKTIIELTRLCKLVLEPVQELLGVPLRITSGFRCPAVNTRVGSRPTSAHVSGRAADFVPDVMVLREAFDLIRSAPGLPIDQIIIENDEWIHIAIAPTGRIPRRQALIASRRNGAWAYAPV